MSTISLYYLFFFFELQFFYGSFLYKVNLFFKRIPSALKKVPCPIDKHEQEIVCLLSHNRVVILLSPPGTGKTLKYVFFYNLKQ